MSAHRHVVPENDLIEHITHANDECPCGPRVELVVDDAGSDRGWLYVHHSLDGREFREVRA